MNIIIILFCFTRYLDLKHKPSSGVCVSLSRLLFFELELLYLKEDVTSLY